MSSKNTHYFEESECTFTFSKEWEVIKYDSHDFYRTVSGRSFSGVDFAGMFKDKLYLIEVKNFYQYNKTGKIEGVDQFCVEMKEKFLDTLDLIRIIQKYHNRKWSYKMFYGLVESYPKLHYTWWFWTYMNNYILDGKVECILLIDSLESRNKIKTKTLEYISAEHDDGISLQVLPLTSNELEGLTVRQD
jgi:hypothetical protein